MNIKDRAISIRKRLSNLAQKHGVDYSYMATTFLIERLVVRIISDKGLHESLIFKGGYVGLRIYHSSRFTIDLDALLVKSNFRETLDAIKMAVNKDIGDAVWFKFEGEKKLKQQGDYGGIRQVYRAGIGEMPKKVARYQIIHFDLGMGDSIIPDPIQAKTSELIGEKELSWYVYPVETIIAEKIHALVKLGKYNSRAKDIFDLSFYLPIAKRENLEMAIEFCFRNREMERPKNLVEYLESIDLSFIRRGWPSAVSGIKNAPDFQASYQKIIDELNRLKVR